MTTGAQDDLEKVTQLAYRQVVQFGMSPVIGHVSFPSMEPGEVGRKPYSNQLSKMIDEEVRSIVNRAYQRTETLLITHTLKLNTVKYTSVSLQLRKVKVHIHVLFRLFVCSVAFRFCY